MNGAKAPGDVINTSHLAFVVEINRYTAAGTVDGYAADDRLEANRDVDNPLILYFPVGPRYRYVQMAHPKHLRIFRKQLISFEQSAGAPYRLIIREFHVRPVINLPAI